jgi:hypothetical protein
MKLGSVIAGAVVSVVLVSVAFAAENKITHRVFTVAATNDEWTQTNIKVAPGDILVTNEAGNKIIVGQYLGATDANGLNNGVGALYMKIGVGAGFKIGAHGYVLATESGVVKLRVNDNKYSDNSGSYTVNIIHIPASLIPPAQAVEQ